MITGAVLIDIGGDITNMALFYDGAIRTTAAIPLGSRNVTNDIAIGLRTTLDQAEELKLIHGSALASMVDPEEMVNVMGVAGKASRDISRNVLASIIEPRMEEILSLVARELKKIGRTENIAAGIVLTGGGALLPGTVELAEQLFDVPVRLGRINGMTHVPDELNSVRFATAHGLLLYGFTNEAQVSTAGRAVSGWWKRIEGWITKQF